MIVRRMLVGAGAAMLATGARAQAWPDRPIRLIVGFAPGGAADTVARLVAAAMTDILGQSVPVENRPGAGANIAAAAVAASAPDAHTLLVGAFAHAVNPSLIPLGFDLAQLQPVVQVTRIPTVVVVPAGSPYRSMADLVAAGRTKAGGLNYASGGSGTTSHLGPELLARRLGLKVTHVPFRGGAPAIHAVMAGQVDFMCDNPSPATIAPGSPIRILAVLQPDRLRVMPDVPSIAEGGYGEGLTIQSWNGFFARAGAPEARLARLAEAARMAVRRPDVLTRFEALGIEAVQSSPDAFAAFFRDEVQRWGAVIREAGIKAE